MSQLPDELHYAETHEWVRLDGEDAATVGISDYAQHELGDVVFVELPALGSQVSARDEVSVVESVKIASDIYAPLSGEIIAVNEALNDSPELINSSPYEDGWIFKIRLREAAELKDLLSAGEYRQRCENE